MALPVSQEAVPVAERLVLLPSVSVTQARQTLQQEAVMTCACLLTGRATSQFIRFRAGHS